MHLSKLARRRREKTIPMVRDEQLENITWNPQTKRVSLQIAGKERTSRYWYTVSAIRIRADSTGLTEGLSLPADEVVERGLSSFVGYAGDILAPLQIKSRLLP